MFSCLILRERQVPLDMMDEPNVWIDKSWPDDSDSHSSSTTEASRPKQQGHLVEANTTAPQRHTHIPD